MSCKCCRKSKHKISTEVILPLAILPGDENSIDGCVGVFAESELPPDINYTIESAHEKGYYLHFNGKFEQTTENAVSVNIIPAGDSSVFFKATHEPDYVLAYYGDSVDKSLRFICNRNLKKQSFSLFQIFADDSTEIIRYIFQSKHFTEPHSIVYRNGFCELQECEPFRCSSAVFRLEPVHAVCVEKNSKWKFPFNTQLFRSKNSLDKPSRQSPDDSLRLPSFGAASRRLYTMFADGNTFLSQTCTFSTRSKSAIIQINQISSALVASSSDNKYDLPRATLQANYIPINLSTLTIELANRPGIYLIYEEPEENANVQFHLKGNINKLNTHWRVHRDLFFPGWLSFEALIDGQNSGLFCAQHIPTNSTRLLKIPKERDICPIYLESWKESASWKIDCKRQTSVRLPSSPKPLKYEL